MALLAKASPYELAELAYISNSLHTVDVPRTGHTYSCVPKPLRYAAISGIDTTNGLTSPACRARTSVCAVPSRARADRPLIPADPESQPTIAAMSVSGASRRERHTIDARPGAFAPTLRGAKRVDQNVPRRLVCHASASASVPQRAPPVPTRGHAQGWRRPGMSAACAALPTAARSPRPALGGARAALAHLAMALPSPGSAQSVSALAAARPAPSANRLGLAP